jgi:putative ABC transport system permease protein
LWLPLGLSPEAASRGSHGLYAAARLAPGTTPEQASEELKAVTAALTQEGHYNQEMGFESFAVPLEDEILGEVRPAILLLILAAAFLLAVACANVASLMLARSEVRQREIAIRGALGAGLGRLVQQLLTESLLLAGFGMLVGLGLAFAGTRLLASWPLHYIPRSSSVSIDLVVLAFAAAAAVAVGVAFGLVSIFRYSRSSQIDGLKKGSRAATAGAPRHAVRHLLVVGQVAFSVVLLIGAGLMIRSLWALARVDLGFDPEHVITLQVSLPQNDYPQPENVVQFYERALNRIRYLPGVIHAGAVRVLPLAATIGDWGLDVEGYEEIPGNAAQGDWQVATPGALEALGVGLVRGRLFSEKDRTEGALVAIVNETMASRYWPNSNPVGGRIRMGGGGTRPWLAVVGVVGDIRHNSIDAAAKEKFYVPHNQFQRSIGRAPASMTLVIKSEMDPLTLVGPIRQVIASIDANLSVSSIRSMTQVVAESITARRFTGIFLTLFAAIGLAIASAGIYGVLSYLVNARSREIGIRLAVGAGRVQILAMVLGRGAILAVAGAAVGVPAALGASQLLAGLLYQVATVDPFTFAAVPVALILVALLASLIPAVRATRVDPVTVLRSE